MSTILDSLKKSSNSRGDNEKASIDSFSFSDNGTTKKSNPAVLLILILLTGVILYFGYHYLYPSSIDVETTSSEDPQTLQEIKDDTIQSPASLATDAQTKQTSKIEKPDSDVVKKILQNDSSENQKLTNNDSIGQIKPADTAKPSNNFQNLSKPLKDNKSGQFQKQSPNENINTNTNINQIKQPKPTDINVQKNVNKPQQTVQNYKLAYQLPFAVRKDIPELILNIHVYDENPNNRIAIINGEKFEVNALIDEEVLVKEIVLEGVVLEFKNEIFLLPKL